ncbi:MAG: hypothetical protein QNI89_04665 [Desulfobacterales bacterium]|nr:hypothetical protein [Desulfobacterales bacterium]MDJ0853775.1 hypothetical protein [Desulfobacterales bacterium]MDJ0886569.1 hypothetical protein [Desulfobacterales bacterium]MDJ0990044.1 hypothetical protein [Desulfobacterales bacterium]
MTDLPQTICDYLCRRSLDQRRPAYLRLDQDGTIRDGGGNLDFHDLDPLAVGQPISAVLDFMEGLLPFDEDTCHLGCLQPQADLCIDVHIIPDNNAHWLLLLDTHKEERQRRAMQQKANELALVREAQARVLTPKAFTAAQRLPDVNFDPRGERREVSVLAAEFRLAATTAGHASPAAIFERLATTQRRMVAGVQADAGLVHSQTDTTLVALFGLLPALGAPSGQALSAAFSLQRQLDAAASDTAVGLLPPAMVVTTGTAVVALETGSAAVHLQAVGPPLQTAAHLLPVALPGRILTDAASFRAAGLMQADFESFETGQETSTRPFPTELRITRS